MEESESPMIKTKRTKRQQEQERLGLEAAVKLQEELDEEERQRIAKVHKEARSFTEEGLEDIRARVEADEELVQRLQIEEIEKVNTFVPMETKVRRRVPELVANSSQAAVREAKGTKRAAEEELGHQSSKKKKSDELSQEELQELMIIINIVRWQMNFFKRSTCRQKDQEDEVFGSILSEHKVYFKKLDDLEKKVSTASTNLRLLKDLRLLDED
nr:hypothetical protein [Tanacetum cinerariifolium]